MTSLFNGCSGLTSIDVSGFDTKNTTGMGWMFGGCSSLTELDLSNFDTSSVTEMHSMFNGCSGLSKLDLSSFDTSNVKYMSNIFFGCSSLTTLDLSSFDTSKVKDFTDAFKDCNKLNTLKIGEKFSNITEEMSLPNGSGWVNANAPKNVVSGNGKYAVIGNNGTNTYKRLTTNALTYPTNIKVEYSKEYHQVRFTWDKVEGADKYGIAVYLAGKWIVQAQDITDTVYTSPKNLTPGKTYKVAIAARVNGSWDTANAIKNAGTITIK